MTGSLQKKVHSVLQYIICFHIRAESGLYGWFEIGISTVCEKRLKDEVAGGWVWTKLEPSIKTVCASFLCTVFYECGFEVHG